MNVALFCHSVLSDWNHGNAHFLRGILRELLRRGHGVRVFEPHDAWSARNLVAEAGEAALHGFRAYYPDFPVHRYELGQLDVEAALEGVDVALVHEWNSPELVRLLGRHRSRGGRTRLLFHDTHHRLLTAPEELSRFDFSGYDAVLAFGEALREKYLERGWGRRAFTWHEAADVELFRPQPALAREALRGDLVWIGNWGDEERSRELGEYLLGPVQALSLRCEVHGVRYPAAALQALGAAGIRYRGWLPNYRVPATFAAFRLTVHVPRRPYAVALPGIPTIRPFEALASGIPLVSAPWSDCEGLFRAGHDYLSARDGAELTQWLRTLLADPELAQELARNGLATIQSRHTCGHRVDELLQICRGIGVDVVDPARSAVAPAPSAAAPAPRVDPAPSAAERDPAQASAVPISQRALRASPEVTACQRST